MTTRLEPKLITLLREGYSLKTFYSDLIAGIVVGIVALPLAIAFGIASGVKPEQGLYTAVVAGFVISFFGGSRVQVSGPTGAFIVVVYGIVQQYGYEGLAVATFLAGLILIAMGFARMGILLRFIPYPVTVGFTSGIALIIFSSQIRDFFGLAVEKVPAPFVDKWLLYSESFHTLNPAAAGVGLVSLLIVFLFPKLTLRIPSSLCAIVLATLAVSLFSIPVETIGTRFGSVPNAIPAPRMIYLSWDLIVKMFPPALTIAFLGAIESLLSAVVADGLMGTRHRSNMELVAQGIGNVISPLFGGIPATGAIARTATNIKNGGQTPVAGLIHAVVLLLIMIFFGKWAALIPMPTLAAILIYVAYNMGDWSSFRHTLRSPKSDVAVLLTTFFLTVLIDLTVAIEVGVVLAAFLFLQRMESVAEIGNTTNTLGIDDDEEEDPNAISKKEVPPGVEVFELYGPLFFGAVERFKTAMKRVERSPKVMILRMRNVPAIDASGLFALEELLLRARRDGTVLLLSGLKAQPREAISESGLAEKIGAQNLLPSIDEALRRARKLVQ